MNTQYNTCKGTIAVQMASSPIIASAATLAMTGLEMMDRAAYPLENLPSIPSLRGTEQSRYRRLTTVRATRPAPGLLHFVRNDGDGQDAGADCSVRAVGGAMRSLCERAGLSWLRLRLDCFVPRNDGGGQDAGADCSVRAVGDASPRQCGRGDAARRWLEGLFGYYMEYS
jgi:hypothetical protein